MAFVLVCYVFNCEIHLSSHLKVTFWIIICDYNHQWTFNSWIIIIDDVNSLCFARFCGIFVADETSFLLFFFFSSFIFFLFFFCFLFLLSASWGWGRLLRCWRRGRSTCRPKLIRSSRSRGRMPRKTSEVCSWVFPRSLSATNMSLTFSFLLLSFVVSGPHGFEEEEAVWDRDWEDDEHKDELGGADDPHREREREPRDHGCHADWCQSTQEHSRSHVRKQTSPSSPLCSHRFGQLHVSHAIYYNFLSGTSTRWMTPWTPFASKWTSQLKFRMPSRRPLEEKGLMM